MKRKRIRGWFAVPFAAFAIPVLLSLLICAGKGVFPFGNRCLLHMDMYHQYCPFFREFLTKLQSGDSLMYSWNIGLGSDFFSVYVYYLASPLNWLLFFCPSAYVIEFMSLLIIAKMGLAGLAFFLFIRERYRLNAEGDWKTGSVVAALVFSTAYAFSGFVAAYNWDIMWMDCVALAPLILLGLERLVKEKRVLLYYVTLSLAILSNYYLSIMICIFLCFAFLGFLLEEKRRRRMGELIRTTGRFAICSLLAGGTGLVMILPELKVLGYSGSSGIDFPESVEWYFDILSELARTGATVETYSGNDHWPNLYAGMFTILLAVLYFSNRRIDWKKQLSHLFMLAFFILSFANNWLDFLWHGLHFPDSLPGRQAFLFAFLLLDMGYEVWEKRWGNSRWQIVLSAVFAAVVLAAGAWVSDPEVTDPQNVLIAILFLLCYGAGMLLERLTEGEKRRLVQGSLAALAFAELTVNMCVTGFATTSRTNYVSRDDNYSSLLALAQEDAMELAGTDDPEQVFYRVEDTERHCKNDDSYYSYHSATQFSSLMNINVSHYFQNLYMEGGKNFYCYNGAIPITSAMLSVQYFLSDSQDAGGPLRTLIGESDGYYLYRNNYSLPLGFVLDESVVTGLQNSATKRLERINELGKLLGAEEDLLTEIACVQEAEAGETQILLPEDGIYYASSINCDPDTLTLRYESGRSVAYSKTTHTYLFELGECAAQESIRITNSHESAVEFHVYRLNMDAVEAAYETLSSQTMELKSYSSTSVEGEIVMTEAGRLVLSIPAEEGWTLWVDGEEQEIEAYEDTFISLHLESGDHEIRLQYQTPGLVIGMAASTACLVLFLLYAGIRRKYEKTTR